jgi:hypothetical protein
MPARTPTHHEFSHAGAGAALFFIQLSAIIPGLLPVAALTAVIALVVILPVIALTLATAALAAPPTALWLLLRRRRARRHPPPRTTRDPLAGRTPPPLLTPRAGMSPEEIDAVLAGEPIEDATLDALVAVAREAAGNEGHVTDAAWRAATDAGVTDAQLAEAYASIGLAVYVDHFVNYADTPFDVPAPATRAAEGA